MRKNKFFLAVPLFFLLSVNAESENFQRINENSLFVELKTSYKNGFFPAVVKYSDEILEISPNSLFLGEIFLYKGAGLLELGQTESAGEFLFKAEKLNAKNAELLSETLFYEGKYFLLRKEYYNALEKFHLCMEKSRNGGEISNISAGFYYSSAFESAGILKKLGEFKNASRLYEFIVANGKKFSPAQYENAVLNLFECLLKTNDINDAGTLCRYYEDFTGSHTAEESLRAENFKKFSENTKFMMILMHADAEVSLKKYKNAYDSYCFVILNGPDSLAPLSMKKAYSLSAEFPDDINDEPGNVIKKAGQKLDSYPELLGEFWTNLAVDAFNEGDYKKALEYFSYGEENLSENNFALASLYKTEIEFLTAKKSSGEENAARDSFKKLSETKNRIKKTNKYFSDIELNLLRYASLFSGWDEILLLTKDFADSDLQENFSYYKSLAHYKKGEYSDALKILEDSGNDKNVPLDSVDASPGIPTLFLKAEILSALGRFDDAQKIFSSLLKKNALTEKGILDYARTILLAGKDNSALEKISVKKGTQAEAEFSYLKGISLFNEENWQAAENCFKNSLTAKSPLFGAQKYSQYARFYVSYSLYQQGKFAESLEEGAKFVRSAGIPGQIHPLIWNGCMTTARSAAQTENLSRAEHFAEQAVKNSKTQAQKEESVFLLAGILNDSGKYEKTLSLLLPFTNEKNTFAYRCLFLAAQTSVLQKNTEQALEYFSALASNKTAGEISEQSLYSQGELLFTKKRFSEAENIFESYIRRYDDGQFVNAAYYFAAQSLVHLQNEQKAILYFLQSANPSGKSTENQNSYRYGSQKALVDLYRKNGNYEESLKIARSMLLEYGKQAADDGISEIEQELSLLASGQDKTLTEKRLEFERSGGIETAQGRKTGTELVSLYAEKSEFKDEAEKLAEKLLLQQEKYDEESEYALENALFLSELYRNRGENKESAQMYLKAAEFARKCGNSEMAARSLYGAAESFDSAGARADAEITIESLVQLYPESVYASESERIMN